MKEDIIKDLMIIDFEYLKINKNSKQSVFFYNFSEKNKLFILNIINIVENYVKNKKNINSYILYINAHIPKNIDYSQLSYIKNNEKYVFLIIALAITWAFNETSKFKYSPIDVNFLHESYALINETISFIEIFKKWSIAMNDDLILTKISNEDSNKSIYKIFCILCDAKLLKTDVTYIRHLNKKKIFYSSDLFNQMKTNKIHTEALKWQETKKKDSILLGNHYSSSWQLFITGKDNLSTFNLNDDSILEISAKLFTNIDFKHFKEIFLIYISKNKLNIDYLEKNYNEYLNELKKSIKCDNTQMIIDVSKKLAVYQKAIELKEILDNNVYEEDEKFFLPWNYDFRGRVYYLSDISFTFHKEFRWCMYQGYYENLNESKPNWHSYNNRIYKILDNAVQNLNKLKGYAESRINNIFVKHAILWTLISLAEINKTKLGDSVHFDKFVIEGVRIFNDWENIKITLDYDETVKAITLIKIIKEFMYDEKMKKRLISKDAPASVFQHLILNFGWKNTEILEKCNLMSDDTWYDTYSFLINKWKETIKIQEKKNNTDEILEFFNRKSLKKVIMTSNYGVGHTSAEKYFRDVAFKLKIEDTDEFLKFLKTNWAEIRVIFEKFFKFVAQCEILKCSPEEIITYISKNKGIIGLKDAIVDINYYKKKKYTIDIIYKGKRYTKSYATLTDERDHRKFEISARAHFVHSLDASLTRWILKKYAIFTIHDCFLIDPINVTYLISLVNEGMNQKFHDFYQTWEKEKTETFSIFILL